MGRRKKRGKFKFILIGLALIGGAWVAADFYFNVYRKPQKETAPVPEAAVPAAKETAAPKSGVNPAPFLENGFKNEIYRDDRYGIEFQYPVFTGNDPQCLKFKKTDDGFSLGVFSFAAGEKNGTLADFIDSELQGMDAEPGKPITVGGADAIRVDYQTGGMGWYGSDVFIERNGKFFEFGLLANVALAKCGGMDDYENKIYEMMISTLKFNN